MEIPPPIPSAPAKNKKLIWILGLGGFAICCGLPIGFLTYGWNFLQRNASVFRCTMTVASAYDAIDTYVKEKGKYPPADNWQEEIAPYFKFIGTAEDEKQAEQAQQTMERMGIGISNIKEPLVCNEKDPTTGIAFNTQVAGKAPADIADKETPVLFETTTVAMNNHSEYVKLPKEQGPKFEGRTRDWMIATVGKGLVNSEGERITFEAGPGGPQVKRESESSASEEPVPATSGE